MKEVVTIEVLHNEIRTLWVRVDELRDEIIILKDKVHTQDLVDVKREHELKELITAAVVEGNKQRDQALQEMQTRLLELIEKSSARITDLENRETQKLAEEAVSAKQQRKEDRRYIWRTIIAVIVTFLATLVLNNIFATISNS